MLLFPILSNSEIVAGISAFIGISASAVGLLNSKVKSLINRLTIRIIDLERHTHHHSHVLNTSDGPYGPDFIAWGYNYEGSGLFWKRHKDGTHYTSTDNKNWKTK